MALRSKFRVHVVASALLVSCGSKSKPPPDWPMYGGNLARTFAASGSAVNRGNVSTLKLAWSFPTGDAVSASPAVVGGVVYAGSWDGYFYALDAGSGALRWKFQLDCQDGMRPMPAQCLAGNPPPDRSDTDGGIITSSASVVDGRVYFGGGKTLYCLDAKTGALVWKHVICGNRDAADCASDTADPTIIFSSPAVFDRKVIVGHTVNGTDGYRGGIVALDAGSGAELWHFEVDPLLDGSGNVIGGVNRGCGSVWASGTVDEAARLVFLGTGDCQSGSPAPYHEALLALDVDHGKIRWAFHPRDDDTCDLDFGATANLVVTGGKRAVGIGGKDGTYYLVDAGSSDPAGTLLWKNRVVFGGAEGGFIGSTAFDGKTIFGGTGIGRVGEPAPCDPNDPRDTPVQNPSFHALSAGDGAIAWEQNDGFSFAASSVADGVVFNGVGGIVPNAMRAYDASSGKVLLELKTKGAVNSSAAIVDRTIYFGTGNSWDGGGSSIQAWRLP